MKVISRLEFELAYYDITVQHIIQWNHHGIMAKYIIYENNRFASQSSKYGVSWLGQTTSEGEDTILDSGSYSNEEKSKVNTASEW